MTDILDDFRAFLDDSPTSWHAVLEIGNRLSLKDFILLKEDEKWNLEGGKKYFVIRGGSLCAFCLPTSSPLQAALLASHTDSPSLKLKPHPEIHQENMSLLETEVYGAPLLTSWLNRDLCVAGRAVVTDHRDQIEEKLFLIDDAPLIIPQLALHLDKEVNEKGLILNKQEHLSPLLSLDKGTTIEDLLRKHHSFKSLLSFDLFLVPIEPSRFLGVRSEMLASSRLDNLASAHACTVAIAVAAPATSTLQMALFCDHEEIGSRSREGAGSPFLTDILTRIGYSLNLTLEEMILIKNRSLCISVDVSQGFNPNYANKYDPNHLPLLGKGIVLKYHAHHKYASTALLSSRLIQLCEQHRLPYQIFAGRSDMACGTTIGPILAEKTGIDTLDIGAPILSMHSIREVMACSDHIDMCQLLTHSLQDLLL